MIDRLHRRLVRRADAGGYLLQWQEQGWIPTGPVELHLETERPQDDVLAVDLGPADPRRVPLTAPSTTSMWPSLPLGEPVV